MVKAETGIITQNTQNISQSLKDLSRSLWRVWQMTCLSVDVVDLRFGNGLRVLVNGITKVGGIHNVQKDTAEKGQHHPSHKITDQP